MVDVADHWSGVYARSAVDTVSWYQAEPVVSLAWFDALGLPPEQPVVDVGAGASLLVDRLLDRGYADLTVLDVSSSALDVVRRRLGGRATGVRFVVADVLDWRPDRPVALWHDRAVFHFLVDPLRRERYVRVAASAVAPGGALVVATFAADGPDRCSGLPTARYDADALAELFAGDFRPVGSRREEHRTPDGRVQPFTWVALQRH